MVKMTRENAAIAMCGVEAEQIPGFTREIGEQAGKIILEYCEIYSGQRRVNAIDEYFAGLQRIVDGVSGLVTEHDVGFTFPCVDLSDFANRVKEIFDFAINAEVKQ